MKVVHAEAYEEGFQAGYNQGQRNAHEDWALDGHGLHCGYETTVPYDDYGMLPDSIQVSMSPITTNEKASISTQTDPPDTTTTSISTQMNPTTPITTSQVQEFVKNGVNACLVPMAATFVQTSLYITHTPSLATTGTQTENTTPQHVEIGYPTRVSMPHTLALPGNRKNTKFGTTKVTVSEISQDFPVFSSEKLSSTSSDSPGPYPTTTALEMQSTMAGFTQKVEKVEEQPIFTQTTPITPAPRTVEPIYGVTKVYVSTKNPNDAILQPPTTSTTASSPQPSASSKHKKSVLSCAVFTSQQPTESLAPTCIVTAQETRLELADFTENHQKTEKSANFNQNHSKLPVLERLDWADDATELPLLATAPMKQPRDLSGLRSSSTNPFVSLRRRPSGKHEAA